MRFHVLAIGRDRDEAISTLVARYRKRCPWPIELRELLVRGKLTGEALVRAEGELLLRHVPAGARVLVLDEGGQDLASTELATLIGNWRDQGVGDIACLIGGADGHAAEVRARADQIIAFGRMTWPHMLVRALLCEQIYRASSILSGHPYHRG